MYQLILSGEQDLARVKGQLAICQHQGDENRINLKTLAAKLDNLERKMNDLEKKMDSSAGGGGASGGNEPPVTGRTVHSLHEKSKPNNSNIQIYML